jgi:hypothetical protein
VGVLPLLRRDRVKLLDNLLEIPSRVKDSGDGSTTLTVKIHRWLTVPLDPVIVILYFPSTVDVVVDTSKLVLVVVPGVSFTGF